MDARNRMELIGQYTDTPGRPAEPSFHHVQVR